MVTEKTQKIHILAKISSARFWLALMAVFLRWWPVVRLPTTIASQFPPFTGPETVDFGKKKLSAYMVHDADRPDRISADERFSGLMACGSSSQSQNEPVSTVRSPRNGPFQREKFHQRRWRIALIGQTKSRRLVLNIEFSKQIDSLSTALPVFWTF